MKKRFVSLLVLCVLLAAIPLSASAAGVGMSNFRAINEYSDGMFADVSDSSWYAESVKAAYEYDLIKGSGAGFNPTGNMTIAEAITLASRLHSIYQTGEADFVQGSVWYQVYVDYAVENGIISSREYSNYTAKATRGQFAKIFASALPETALQIINDIADGKIPDVTGREAYGYSVYVLYRAGVLTGSDEYGTFNPDSYSSRSEVAAITTRMASQRLRKPVKLVSSRNTLSNGLTEDDCEQFFSEGVAQYNGEEYIAAIECFIVIPYDSERYDEAQEKLEACEKAYSKSVITKAEEYVERNDYEVALELLNGARDLLPNNKELSSAYGSIYVEYKDFLRGEVFAKAEFFLANGDYPSAIYTVRNALNEIPRDEELQAKLRTYENAYRNQLLVDADDILRSEGYREAISALNEGLSILEYDDVLLDRIEVYKSYAPVEIMEMEPFSGRNNANLRAVTDTFGNEYSRVYVVSTNYGTKGFSVLLNGNYSTLSGTIIWSKEDKNNDGYYSIQFYDDEQLIYATEACSAKSGPVSFSFDISNVKILSLKFEGFSNDGPFDQNIVALTAQK